MKHIIYECLHLSRSVPISYRENIYFLFFIFHSLCSTSQTGKDDKHGKQAKSAFSQAMYRQRVRKLGSWWLGDRGGDMGMADMGKLAQLLFKRAVAEGTILKQLSVLARHKKKGKCKCQQASFRGKLEVPRCPPTLLGAVLPTWLGVCPSEELPALLLSPQECLRSHS